MRLHLEGDSCNDVQRVNDVAQRFAHLPPVGVSHHCMQIHLEESIRILSHVRLPTPASHPVGLCADLFEGQLAGQFEAHHHHTGDPEEQDVMARLQQSARVEHIQVLGLREQCKRQH